MNIMLFKSCRFVQDDGASDYSQQSAVFSCHLLIMSSLAQSLKVILNYYQVIFSTYTEWKDKSTQIELS